MDERLNVYLGRELRQRVADQARKTESSEADVVRRAVEFYFAGSWFGVMVRILQTILFEILLIRTTLTAYVSVTTEAEWVKRRKPTWIKVSKRRLKKITDGITTENAFKKHGVRELAEVDSDSISWDEVEV